MTFKRLSLLIILSVAVSLVASSLVFAGNNKKITVLAIVYVKAGLEEKTKQELLKLVPLTHQEPGCINYDMHVNIDLKTLKENPRIFMFYENWRSREDWDLHMKMPYLQNWIKMSGDLTDKIELTIWEMEKANTNPTFRGGVSPQPEETFTLLAQILLKPGTEDMAYKELLSLVPLTHQEPGCINYNMHIGLNMDTMAPDPRRILFQEDWYNYKVWNDDHMKSGYLVRWLNLAPKVTDKAELTGWKKMDFSEKYKSVKWNAEAK